MGYQIDFPTPLEKLDPRSDNLDVCVRRDDGSEFTFVVATPENLKAMMAAEGTGYLSPASPLLIAETLTEDVIDRLIREVMTDDALMHVYGSDI